MPTPKGKPSNNPNGAPPRISSLAVLLRLKMEDEFIPEWLPDGEKNVSKITYARNEHMAEMLLQIVSEGPVTLSKEQKFIPKDFKQWFEAVKFIMTKIDNSIIRDEERALSAENTQNTEAMRSLIAEFMPSLLEKVNLANWTAKTIDSPKGTNI